MSRPVMQMDRFYFGLVRFSNIQILNRFGALIGLIWIGFGALARTGSPVKLDLEVVYGRALVASGRTLPKGVKPIKSAIHLLSCILRMFYSTATP